MSILPFIGNNVNADTVVDITEAGTTVAERYQALTPTMKVLAALRDAQRPMTVSEVSREARVDINQTKKAVDELKRKKLVMLG